MSSKVSSFEEKVKLPPTETISRCYQPQGNRNRIIRILTVAVYVLCVSLAAIMLSLYYIFIWDPTVRPFIAKGNNCEKIVIPEKIAIRLLNSSEVTAEQFYRHILDQYRILNQLQIQRQQFLQRQHLQLQQLAATNRFQEIFATATIIQANPNDRILKPITPTNGTFLLDPRPMTALNTKPVTPPTTINEFNLPPLPERLPILDTLQPLQQESQAQQQQQQQNHQPLPQPTTNKRKTHRKHSNHHRHNSRKNHKKTTPQQLPPPPPPPPLSPAVVSSRNDPEHFQRETPLNPPSPAIIMQDAYTSMPIPLILNSKEDSEREREREREQRIPYRKSTAAVIMDSARPPLPSSAIYANARQPYLNPLLNGELIFEK